MKPVYNGKTKDVFQLENGNYLLKFKDDLTGENGIFNPGSNSVGLTLKGAGEAALRLTRFFFEKLEENGIPTHYISTDLKETTMTVKPATFFGKGIEVICRYRAVGSFLKRYGAYIEEGAALDSFVEITLKDDARSDPPITEDALAMLGILTKDEYKELKSLTQKISAIVKEELAKKKLELYDIKLEFGRLQNNQIALIDEISGGNMRAYMNGKHIQPLELTEIMLT